MTQGQSVVGELFQSTPAIADGRSIDELFIQAAALCFNPRPPLLTGEARRGLGLAAEIGVSIHARHC